MTPVAFVDTSLWFAASLDDAATAEPCRAALAAARTLETSDLVIAEVWLLLAARRLGHLARGACAELAARAEVLQVEGADRRRAFGILETWADQPFSYTDATSFALMERHEITEALSLDGHFRVFRAGPRRDRAFVVRP